MPRRTINVSGQDWSVSSTGRVTQYTRDEIGLVFSRAGARGREERVTRFAPLGSRSPERALAELPEAQLVELFQRSQPSWTAPETEYRR
ncbi:MAG TPA: hypothetical protein VJN95_03970 [Gemmatimonadales bacterium]|nr:hypothetical protein [Gemmatimonadales bacterium]